MLFGLEGFVPRWDEVPNEFVELFNKCHSKESSEIKKILLFIEFSKVLLIFVMFSSGRR